LMSDEELALQDIALVNLRCAEGLPGSEKLNVSDTLHELDRWATRVRIETDRNFHLFAKKPDDFQNSEAYFGPSGITVGLVRLCGKGATHARQRTLPAHSRANRPVDRLGSQARYGLSRDPRSRPASAWNQVLLPRVSEGACLL
jgi:hypothetical protein